LPPSAVDMATMLDTCERILGKRPTAPVPDAIAAVGQASEWKPFPDWESKADAQIAIRAGLYAVGFSGALLVVTEASFRPDRGAFLLDARDLDALVCRHLAWYGECFFNGDVIIAERDGRRIWLFHHEGCYATISAA